MASTNPALTLRHHREAMRMVEPFRISGYLFEAMPSIVATVSDGAHRGRGEAAGVYYFDDDPAHMAAQIEAHRGAIEAGVDRAELQRLLPRGGARNAVDCALWELESLRRRIPVWQLAGVPRPRPRVTAFTLPAEDPAYLLERLPKLAFASALKLKLSGELEADTARVTAVRAARPDAWIAVDANQGFAAHDLDALGKMLVTQRVALLEQPVRRGEEQALDGWRSPVPVAADESIQDLAELEALGHLFQVMNIKLDKSGGLTEALAMARLARRMGMQVMVGNMAGSTLSAAPGFVLAQLCDVVDLDGPYFLVDDPLAKHIYQGDRVMVPEMLWGHG